MCCRPLRFCREKIGYARWPIASASFLNEPLSSKISSLAPLRDSYDHYNHHMVKHNPCSSSGHKQFFEDYNYATQIALIGCSNPHDYFRPIRRALFLHYTDICLWHWVQDLNCSLLLESWLQSSLETISVLTFPSPGKCTGSRSAVEHISWAPWAPALGVRQFFPFPPVLSFEPTVTVVKKVWATMLAKWSACSPSTLSVRVRFPLKSTIFR